MWERLERREIKQRAPQAGTERQEGVAGTRPRPDLPLGTDLLPQIRDIVILMMENHSYDNYLGMLAGRGEGLPLGPDGVPSWNMPPLTHRDAAAESPLDALDLDAAPAFLTPPDLPKPTLRWGSWTP